MTLRSFTHGMTFLLGAIAAVVVGCVCERYASAATPTKAPEPTTQPGPAVTRRLTEDQYRRTIADIFGPDIKIEGRFDPEVRVEGLLEIGTGSVSVSPAGFEQYDVMARSIAAQFLSEEHRKDHVGCQPASASAPDDACAGQFLAKYGRLLFRRPLTSNELEERVHVANLAAQKLNDFYAGLQFGLTGMLMAPQFLFRQEVMTSDPQQPQLQRLDAYSLASRLSFLLWNTTPDEELLSAAERGDLDTTAGLARQVQRLMKSPRLEVGVRTFFADMLGFDAFDSLAKDPIIYPKFNQTVAKDAQEQTLRTIADALIAHNGDYRDLFTTRKTFVTRTLGMVYRVPVSAPPGEWQPYEFAADDPRAGLLTQASFLELNAHPGRSSATLRGKAIREVMLCQRVPPPPSNVDFTVVQNTDNPVLHTARARLSAHTTDATCAGCHRVIDPPGLALENYDSIGAYRTKENGALIETNGDFDGAQFADAATLGKLLHDNPATSSCLVRRAYTYAMGRDVTKGERQFLRYLETSFADNGHRLPDLLKVIAESNAYRLAEPAQNATARVVSVGANTQQELAR